MSQPLTFQQFNTPLNGSSTQLSQQLVSPPSRSQPASIRVTPQNHLCQTNTASCPLSTELPNLLDSLMKDFDPEEPIFSTAQPACTTSATTTETTTQTDPVDRPNDNGPTLIQALQRMTDQICTSLDKHTQQTAMMRATMTTFLRRMEDHDVAAANRDDLKRPRSPEKKLQSVAVRPKKSKK